MVILTLAVNTVTWATLTTKLNENKLNILSQVYILWYIEITFCIQEKALTNSWMNL